MVEREHKCEYCGIKMQKFNYEINKGYCGKCRELMDWKDILDDIKELKR